MSDAVQNVKVSRDDARWEVEVKAEITPEAFARFREEELKELQKTAKLDGFRPGKAPLERIVAVYGEPAILRGAAERAILHELPEILAAQKFLIVETPRVQSPAPEIGKPLPFTARAGLAPEVKLSDWKAIAKKHNEKKEEVVVSDQEHQEALTHLRRERARIENLQTGLAAQAAAEASKAMPESELPLLDDEFVRSIGYESAEKFIESVRSNMQAEKVSRASEARRTAILDYIVKAATIQYPMMLKEYELDDMESRISEDLSRMGSSFENYMKEAKKTREQLRGEWSDAADKRARVRLVLTEIARQEKIAADKERVAEEFEHAKKHYPGASEENMRAGIEHALRNEKVLQLLETL